MHARSLPALAGSALLAVALAAALVTPASAAPVVGGDDQTEAGLEWLATQQQDDGGFEVLQFPPFETPDVIVAIAEDAQTTGDWSTAEAKAAVLTYDGGDDGPTPLDWAGEFAETIVVDEENPGAAGGQAAKIIALVAAPLGEPTDAFDPDGNGTAVDLEQLLAEDPPETTWDDLGEDEPFPPFGIPLFNSYLYATFADVLTEAPGLDQRVEDIRRAQQDDGGWNFAGDPNGTDVDPDTTGYAITALIAAGVPAGDATVEAGLRMLAREHTASGSGAWPIFGSDNVNSTATGVFGVEAAGWDQGEQCWRQVNAPGSGNQAYVTPDAYIRSQQVPADPPPAEPEDVGRFLSPNDGFGVNTFPTSQALQGLFRTWLPLERAELQALEQLDAFTDVPDCAYYSQGVSWMVGESITNGYPDDTFRPVAGITRQAMAALLFRFSGEVFDAPEVATFTDVSVNHPFFEEIEWMADEGITNGYPDDTFRPSGAVNRQQAAAFLHRIAGEPVVPAAEDAPTFPDVSGGPFFDAITWMAEHRLTNPYPDGTFRSLVPLNRGQLSTFLYRLASTESAWGEVGLPATVLF